MLKPILLMLALIVPTASADEVNVTFFGQSTHLIEGDFNDKHELFGVEYIDTSGDYDTGHAVSSYVNSYNIQGYMYTYSLYSPYDAHKFRTIFTAGATTGYKDTGGVCIIEVGELCSVLAIGVEYGKYKLVPRITLFGPALVFSLSYKF